MRIRMGDSTCVPRQTLGLVEFTKQGNAGLISS